MAFSSFFFPGGLSESMMVPTWLLLGSHSAFYIFRFGETGKNFIEFFLTGVSANVYMRVFLRNICERGTEGRGFLHDALRHFDRCFAHRCQLLLNEFRGGLFRQ